MTTERRFDIPLIASLALKEKQIQQNYRPIIAVHTRNITMVVSELENRMAAVAGLFPTWDLPPDQHRVGAHAAISKLAMGTCFGQQSGI